MALLIFKADDVRRVVEHALTAKEHQPEVVDYGNKANDWTPTTKPGTPAVILVHDHGVYLMSNGTPRDLVKKLSPNGKHETDSSFCAYAKGCNPDTQEFDDWWETSRNLVGGDDFAETLHWAEAIKKKLDGGAKEIRINITSNKLMLR